MEVYFYSQWNSSITTGFALTVTLVSSKDFSLATVSVQSNYQYNAGNAIDIAFTVRDVNGTVLTEGTDFDAVITNSADEVVSTVTALGTYTLTVTGKGDYTADSKTTTFNVVDNWGIAEGADGTSEHPYLISNVAGLDNLSESSNNGNNYDGKTFVLTANIAYDSSVDNNFTPIGTFKGTFDGDGHTISGIRINRSSDEQLALFSYVSSSSIVKNITLDDTQIVGKGNLGGIAGSSYGTITNCHITSTVSIQGSNRYIGGIAAWGGGTVSYCTSSVTISGSNYNSPSCTDYGGIVGYYEGKLTGNIATHVRFYQYYSNAGGITGSTSSATATNNYINDCYGGPTRATFATPATILSESEAVSSSLSGTVAFRREFKGGKPSTLIFPFAYTKGMEGTYYTFSGVTYDDVEGKWKATMTEFTGTTLAANTPYLFEPAGTDVHTPVVFHGTAAYDDSSLSTTSSDWTFIGTYAEKTWTAGECGNDYGFAATNGTATDGVTEVKAGDFVKIAEGAHIRPLRSYLTYTGSDDPWAASSRSASMASLPQRISVVLVKADGQTTEISEEAIANNEEFATAPWYTLDGRRLNGKPATRGLYIVNRHKVVIR